jgi:hypothetical protein
MDNLHVRIQFRGHFQWPFRPGDVMVFCRQDHVTILTLPYELVIRALRLYIDGATIQAIVTQQLRSAPMKPLAKALPFTPDKRRELRAQRQKNKGRRRA